MIILFYALIVLVVLVNNTQNRNTRLQWCALSFTPDGVFPIQGLLLLLNRSQGDIGVPGPNGIVWDFHPAVGPTKESFHPEQYKVRSLQQNGRGSRWTKIRRRKKRNFLWPFTNNHKASKRSHPAEPHA